MCGERDVYRPVVPWGVGTDIHVPDSDVSVLSVFFSCDREVTKHVAHEASVTCKSAGERSLDDHSCGCPSSSVPRHLWIKRIGVSHDLG